MITILEIKQLILKLNIGIDNEERAHPQDIEFNITINFQSRPQACDSDKINETLCYAKIVDAIKIFCSTNEFTLIEYLSFSLYKYLKTNFLAQHDKLILQVCKHPPIELIKGQCCFTIKD